MHDAAARARVVRFLAAVNLLTPLDTQAAVPLVPLYLTDVLGRRVADVGVIATGLAAASMVSLALLPTLVRRVGARSVLVASLLLRLVAGAGYLSAFDEGGWGASPSASFAALVAARALHGLTLSTFALPNVWIAAHVPADGGERVRAVALTSAALVLGVAMGPSWGAVLAWAWQRGGGVPYAAPGAFTVLESAACLIAVLVCGCGPPREEEEEDADKPTPSSADAPPPPLAAPGGRGVEAPFLWYNACITLGFMMGFEALLPLAARDTFGWDAVGALRVWLSLAAALLAGFALAPPALRAVPGPRLAASLAAAALAMTLASAVDVGGEEWRVYVGAAGLVPLTVLSTQTSVALMRVTPADAQAGVQARYVMAGQVGRTVGAVVAPRWYDAYTRAHGAGAGYTAAALFLAFWVAAAVVPLGRRRDAAYGPGGATAAGTLL